VVFLVYNRREALRESMQRMTLESGYPSDRLEVIVVDNASNDGTATMVRAEFPDVRLVETGRNLGAPGWNAGFAVARGDYVLILDDDAYLKPGGIQRAVEAAQQEDAGLVSFTVVSSYDEAYRFNDEWNTGLLSYWGCAALVSRNALDQLGGYDPDIFIWGNELEFTMRLLDRGYAHLYLPDVVAVHMKKPDARFNLAISMRNFRHWSYVAAKLMTLPDAVKVLSSLLLHVVLGTLAVDRRTIRGLPQVITGFGLGLRRRSPVRAVVSRTYREDCRFFAWPWAFLRTPGERWRSYRHGEDPEQQRQRRQTPYFTNRRAMYPVGRGSLKL
jgi:GT2 family glycosyltransferase